MLFSLNSLIALVSVSASATLALAMPTNPPTIINDKNIICVVTNAQLDPSTYKISQDQLVSLYSKASESLHLAALNAAPDSQGKLNLNGDIQQSFQPLVSWPKYGGIGPIIPAVIMQVAYTGSLDASIFGSDSPSSQTGLAALQAGFEDLFKTVVNNGHFYSIIEAQCLVNEEELGSIKITSTPIGKSF